MSRLKWGACGYAALLAVLLLNVQIVVSAGQQEYLVGIGKSDVTGPAADVGMLAYAVMNQTAKGIHTRQWATAYVFAEAEQQ
jgi:neutral ceramidase